MLLIQGFFCQEVSGLGEGYAPGEGPVVMVHRGYGSVMFAGVIHDPDNKGNLKGQMDDQFGHSELLNIVRCDHSITFEKRYEGKDPLMDIEYSFVRSRDDITWVGKYTIPLVESAKGLARCVITEVPKRLFLDDLDDFARELRNLRA